MALAFVVSFVISWFCVHGGWRECGGLKGCYVTSGWGDRIEGGMVR